MSWGRLRAEKWKRSVQGVLALWEGWCVFPQASQEHFSTVFANPPLTKEEEAAAAAAEREKLEKEKAKRKWKTVEERTAERETEEKARGNGDAMDVDVGVDGLDGEPMPDEDDDIDGEPMDDEDIDGEPMADSEDEEAPPLEAAPRKAELSRREALAASIAAKLGKGPVQQGAAKGTSPAGVRRERPKASDMFADSDGE
ncbi:hypothetical protein P7C71_g863, partial [Lecanoromycetidae sp. Uapishka_2]